MNDWESLKRSDRCPGPEEWAAFLAGESPHRDALEAHRADCPACSAEARLMASFFEAKPRPEEEEDLRWIERKLQPKAATPAPDRRFLEWLPWRAWAAAAVALLVTAVGLDLWHRRTPAIGGPDGPDVVRSAGMAAEIESPSGDVSAPPREVRWKPVSGAVRYQVQILEVDGTELRTLTSPGPISLELPQDLFLPRKTLLLRVTAFSPENRVLAVSTETRVRYTPGGN